MTPPSTGPDSASDTAGNPTRSSLANASYEGQAPDTGHSRKEFPTEAELEARVVQIRNEAPRSKELVDAILDYLVTLRFKPAIAEPLVREAVDICEEIGDQRGRACAQVAKAGLKLIRTAYSECVPIIAEALPVLVEHGVIREYGFAMLALSTASQTTGAYDQALDYCFRILSAEHDHEYEETAAWTHYRVADIYRELGDGEAELNHAQECFEAFEDLYARSGWQQHRVGLGRARTQLAAAYQKAGKLDKALEYDLAALEEFREAKDQLGETRALTDLGSVFLMRGDAESAEAYLLEALEIRRKVGHRASQTTNLLALGELYLEQGDNVQAEEMLKMGLVIAEEADIKMRAYEFHEALSRLYKVTARPSLALRHHEIFHALKDEVAGEAMSLKIRNRKVLAEIDRAEREAQFERAKAVELAEKNEELARLLAELRSTQDRLIQSEKMASLGQLTAGIAHEIRNPLNFVNNFSVMSSEIVDEMTEALERSSARLDETQRSEMHEYLETLRFNTGRIREHGARAEAIVAGMMEHARTGSRERKRINVNELVEEYVLLAYHAQIAMGGGVPVFVYRNYDETLGSIECVPSEIGRVLLNLVNNAFDALTEEDHDGDPPRITISTTKVGQFVEIRVSDNGPGIPDDIMTRIFEPFFTTKPTGSGTGLGLSMSYDMITKGHGGELRAFSRPGNGSTFTLRLPA